MSTKTGGLRVSGSCAATVVLPPGAVAQAVVVATIATFAFGGRAGGPDFLPVVAGRYAALAVIGCGSHGVVYRAFDRHTGAVVALKLVWLGAATGAEVARAEREAACASRVRHRNVIRVLDSGRWEWFHYLVLEYAPGGTLKERLAAAGRLTAREATRWLGPAVRGVAAAHAQGVVHRDLKPANILFDAAGRPKIVDFGLAKGPADPAATSSGEVVGTPAYMAPEQARGAGKHAAPAADVWSLGAVLYECVAGAPPFEAENVCALLDRLRASDDEVTADSLRLRAAGVPDNFDDVCMKCLAKDPAARYRDAGELADDLERFLAGLPVLAPPLALSA